MVELRRITLGADISYIFFSAVIAITVAVISYQLWTGANTRPKPFLEEGFAGPVNGTSNLTCGDKSLEATKLYDMFLNKKSSTEVGADDLLELQNLLGKFCCLKQDLLAPGSLVNATKNSPYITSQDIEQVSETVARCFSKTIPKRDIDIIVDKWAKRGDMLVRRLCTSYNLGADENKQARSLLSGVLADVTDILMTVCLKGPVTIAGEDGPRMVNGLEPASLLNLGSYKGYY
jgi:hypothetical protein|uniref:Uncharacterized protein n=1 Tax=viral metagenome TaxID=1070528 RepID=A0A6C0JXZ2_9ZZZZ